ncbi:ABC transporter substrate-binding protein [Chitinimonas koreensis]|uniref:ABC transporter substrate-binding protein n=1 Tax=Chitinimonas koreensis TaxID=356302 RepID=UPI00048E1091|nr:ABC transporter substrate-binding protein [Chitinimonas koreensis]QNM96215.1 ABC transporter substrate-binding protein [Chitinimonas koreensis]
MRQPSRLARLLSCLSVLAAVCGPAHAEIVIGQSAPLSAAAGDSGRGLSLGVAVAIAEANAGGGIGGEKLRLALLDDQGRPELTRANTAALIDKEGALALAGYYGAQNAVEAARLADGRRIALVGTGSGAAQVVDGDSRYAYHLRPGYQAEVEKLIGLLADKLGVQRIGLLIQNDAFGRGGGEVALAELARRQLKPTAVAQIEPGGEGLAAAAEQMVQASPDAVLVIAISKPAGLFVRRFRELGGAGQLYSLSSANYEEVVQLIGAEAARGVGIVQVYPYPADTRIRLVRDYQAAMQRFAPRNAKLSYASMEGYIAGRTVLEAIRRAGRAPSREAVAQALDGLTAFDLGGFVLDFGGGRRVGSRFVELTMISGTGNLSR